MKSSTTSQFWKLYYALPERIQRLADKAYQIWKIDPHAHSLYFKRVGNQDPIYSAHVGRGYRVLGLLEGDEILWFWIGPHDEYIRLLKHK